MPLTNCALEFEKGVNIKNQHPVRIPIYINISFYTSTRIMAARHAAESEAKVPAALSYAASVSSLYRSRMNNNFVSLQQTIGGPEGGRVKGEID